MIRALVTATAGSNRVTLSIKDAVRENHTHTNSVTVWVPDNTIYPVGTFVRAAREWTGAPAATVLAAIDGTGASTPGAP